MTEIPTAARDAEMIARMQMNAQIVHKAANVLRTYDLNRVRDAIGLLARDGMELADRLSAVIAERGVAGDNLRELWGALRHIRTALEDVVIGALTSADHYTDPTPGYEAEQIVRAIHALSEKRDAAEARAIAAEAERQRRRKRRADCPRISHQDVP